MSFRETRNFCEVLRNLGYPRMVSMENFKMPNFVLLAEIIEWLLRKYDPSVDLSEDIEKESDRVNFMNRAVDLVAQRAKIRLNPRKLYHADGRAVQELLKFATFLSDSLKASNQALNTTDTEALDQKLTARAEDLRRLRELTNDISNLGSTLVSILNNEVHNREARERALVYLETASRDMTESGQQKLFADVQRLLGSDRDEHKRLQSELSSLEQEGRDAKEKFERSKEEASRVSNRLEQLRLSKPTFWREYERVDGELQEVYALWVEKQRNLDYVEAELTELTMAEERELLELERELKDIQKKSREEDLTILRGELNANEGVAGGAKGGKSSQGNTKGNTRRPIEFDDDEDDDLFPPAPAGGVGANARSRMYDENGIYDDEDGSDDDDDDLDGTELDEDDDDDADSFGAKPKNRGQYDFDDDDADF